MESDEKQRLKDKPFVGKTALYVTRVAVMSGMLTALKFALSFIPNVEVVTLLIIVYASAWGLAYAIPAALVFCAVEVAIYGVGSWVLLYFIYFPFLALVAGLFLKKDKAITAVIIATVSSVIFGVLSACADTLFVVGYVPISDLGKYWAAYYVRGLYFDLIHVISAAVTVGALYKPLFKASKRISHGGDFPYDD